MAVTSSCLRASLQPANLQWSLSGETSSFETWSNNAVKRTMPSQSVPHLPPNHHSVRPSFEAAAVLESDSHLQSLNALNGRRSASVVCSATVSGRQESERSRASAKGGPEEGPVTPFHLAFPVNDLEATRDFYGRVLGCPEGRVADTWIDYNLFGHQIVCHLIPGYNGASTANPVDGDPVPVPHFGLVMTQDDFHALATRVQEAGIDFVIEPHIRFKGAPGEQWTMFFKDPSGNSLEFKAMTNPNNLFAKYKVDT